MSQPSTNSERRCGEQIALRPFHFSHLGRAFIVPPLAFKTTSDLLRKRMQDIGREQVCFCKLNEAFATLRRLPAFSPFQPKALTAEATLHLPLQFHGLAPEDGGARACE